MAASVPLIALGAGVVSLRIFSVFWTGFFVGLAVCLAIGLISYFLNDRCQRAAFIARLSPEERERLKGFESVSGDWRHYRDLLHRNPA